MQELAKKAMLSCHLWHLRSIHRARGMRVEVLGRVVSMYEGLRGIGVQCGGGKVPLKALLVATKTQPNSAAAGCILTCTKVHTQYVVREQLSAGNKVRQACSCMTHAPSCVHASVYPAERTQVCSKRNMSTYFETDC